MSHCCVLQFCIRVLVNTQCSKGLAIWWLVSDFLLQVQYDTYAISSSSIHHVCIIYFASESALLVNMGLKLISNLMAEMESLEKMAIWTWKVSCSEEENNISIKYFSVSGKDACVKDQSYFGIVGIRWTSWEAEKPVEYWHPLCRQPSSWGRKHWSWQPRWWTRRSWTWRWTRQLPRSRVRVPWWLSRWSSTCTLQR